MSDVWSYGVVLYEIFTKGAVPYPSMNNASILPELLQGYRMEQPVECPDDVYSLMTKCWRADPLDRPAFADIKEELSLIMSENDDYICMGKD